MLPTTRTATEHLAKVLADPPGTVTLARLQVAALPDQRSTDLPLPTPRPDRVGVWRRTGEKLVRAEDAREEWRFWADQDVLPASSEHVVAVVGESAARGYFYDPSHSLASVTATVLEGDECVVWDLARTNCSLTELLRTACEAIHLGAEALVVYAGNNWGNVEPTPVERQELAEALRAGGFPQAGHRFRELVGDVAASALELLGELAGTVPVVLVVPEFNHVGWVDEETLAVPALPDGALSRWRTLRRAAEADLARGEHDAARTAIAEMLRLDGGSSPVTHRLTASCASDPVEVRAALEAAADAVVSPFAIHSPRILSGVRARMLATGARLGFAVVDQAALLASSAGGPADPDFFLDYCHLSFSGLARTGAAVAEALGTVLPFWPDRAREGGSAVPPRASSWEEATAHFLAAIHNAHYGQPEATVRRHLRAAVEADESVRALFADYLDYQVRTAPNWMCGSYMRSADDPRFARYLVPGDGRLNSKLGDHAFHAALLQELDAHDPAASRRHLDLLRAERGGEQDLLDDAHLASTFNERFGSWLGPQAAYHRAPLSPTRSAFVADPGTPMELSLTWRLAAAASGPTTVRLNGTEVAQVHLGTGWVTIGLVLEPGLLREGVNELDLEWPAELGGHDLVTEQAADRVECGEDVPGHPVFGHVAGWTVRPTRG